MLRISPFEAIRPHPSVAARVASLPYDVVNTDEARELAASNPHSFLHVVRSEIDLPAGTNVYADAVYDKAAANFNQMIRDEVLTREEEPSIYLYRQVMDHHPQIGVVCCCHIDDYLSNVIKKHENTRPAKEDDRTRHVMAINANAGPVFLTHHDSPEIDALVQQDTNHRPLYHFDAPDGVTHTVWRVQDPQQYVQAFGTLGAAYVADGHHRSASASRAGAMRREANAGHTGDEQYNWFLSVLFPASQLHILPYNRVITDLAGQTPQELSSKLAQLGVLSTTSNPLPDRPGVMCFYLQGQWQRLEIDPGRIDADDPIESLDVALLQRLVLEPMLGIADQRTDERIDFVGGIRGTGELERLVDGGMAALAVSMFATSIEQLLAVSDAGLIMPPKSTWFEPKLRSGLFVHSLD